MHSISGLTDITPDHQNVLLIVTVEQDFFSKITLLSLNSNTYVKVNKQMHRRCNRQKIILTSIKDQLFRVTWS